MAACVDEAIALGMGALTTSTGQTGDGPFAMDGAEVTAQRRAAGEAEGWPGRVSRGLSAAGPVDAGLVDAYAAAMGLKLAVYRVIGDDLCVWWRSACAACRGQHRAHGSAHGCDVLAATAAQPATGRTVEVWTVWRAEGDAHAEYVGNAEAVSATEAVRACTWEVRRSGRRGGKLTEDRQGVAGAWGGPGRPVGMLGGWDGAWAEVAGGGADGGTADDVSDTSGTGWGDGGRRDGTDEGLTVGMEAVSWEARDEEGTGPAGEEATWVGPPAEDPPTMRGLRLTDAVVRQWSRLEEFDFWIAGGATCARGLEDVVWEAAAVDRDADDKLVFFTRRDSGHGSGDWASGDVFELRNTVVDLIVVTMGPEMVWGARRGMWAGVGGPIWRARSARPA